MKRERSSSWKPGSRIGQTGFSFIQFFKTRSVELQTWIRRWVMVSSRGIFIKGLWVIWTLVACWLPLQLGAQTMATLQGTVKDGSGSVMPGVQIEIKNQGTGATRHVTTGAQGTYRAGELPAGFYSVEARMEGFQTQRRTGMELFIGGTAVVDLTMAVGVVTSLVEVSATPNIVA